ncbi:MAG: hypothetical protein OXF20_13200 [Gammaproteobacteria bacterium]|nr:hypothetical protein [Gammaproteobacteria bacterium]MCY4228619.1 hypothetical protein [Gammaproteobacteria bacterium]
MATVRENNGDASAGIETTYTISLGDVFEGTLEPAEDKDWNWPLGRSTILRSAVLSWLN